MYSTTPLWRSNASPRHHSTSNHHHNHHHHQCNHRQSWNNNYFDEDDDDMLYDEATDDLYHYKPKHSLNSSATLGNRPPPPFTGQWFDYWLARMNRELGKTSTFKIIVIAILFHSIISIVLIYVHLSYFAETYHGRHASEHYHPVAQQGMPIMVQSKQPLTLDDIDMEYRLKIPPNGKAKIDYTDVNLFGPQSVNLLHSKLIDSSELTHIGWFSDHARWEERYQCFNNRWTLCDKIFMAKCRADSIRAIYQYVPFKRSANVRHLFFSIRASAEQLVEQQSATDGFYGLMALIHFYDNQQTTSTKEEEEEVVKLKFQYESDAWSLRTLNYESKSKSIRSVTVMIACFGYSGVASFTDIRVSSRQAGVDPFVSIYELGDWCEQSMTTSMFSTTSKLHVNANNQTNFELLNLQLANNGGQQQSSASAQTQPYHRQSLLTYVTQVSMDRLTVLERSLASWTGVVSIAIQIPVKSYAHGIEDWHRLYIKKKISALNISIADSSIVLVPVLEGADYPINRLRNFAIEQARTRFIFLVDADFQPSPGLEQNFIALMHRYHYELYKNIPQDDIDESKRKLAFVIPAFEYLETPNKGDPILKSKDELIQLIHREDPILQPFRVHEANEAHHLTDYWQWYYTKEPYFIGAKYHDKFEPYIIVEKNDQLPRFDERLTNYGMNKVMHCTELFAANYTFQVLDTGWIIHFPHQSTNYYQDFLQNLEHRLHNRAQRFIVLEDIIHRYRVPLQECVRLNLVQQRKQN